MKKIIILTLIIITSIFFFSCDMRSMEGKGTLVIRLPGESGSARTLTTTEKNKYLSELRYSIVCSGLVSMIKRDAGAGETVPLYLTSGKYIITVTITNKNGRVIGSETKTETIEAGEKKSVNFNINLDEPIYFIENTYPEKQEDGTTKMVYDWTIGWHTINLEKYNYTKKIVDNNTYIFNIKGHSNTEIHDIRASLWLYTGEDLIDRDHDNMHWLGNSTKDSIINFKQDMDFDITFEVTVNLDTPEGLTQTAFNNYLNDPGRISLNLSKKVNAIEKQNKIMAAITHFNMTEKEENVSWSTWKAQAAPSNLNVVLEEIGNKTVKITVNGTPSKDRWHAVTYFYNNGLRLDKGKAYLYTIEMWTEKGEEDREVTMQYYENNDTETYLELDRININSEIRRYELITPDILPGSIDMFIAFQCGDQLGTFYIKVIGIEEADDPKKLLYTPIRDETGTITSFSIKATNRWVKEGNDWVRDIKGAVIIPDLWRLNKNVPHLPVTEIAEKAFNNCVNITSVSIGDNVNVIGDSAFSYCTNVTSVIIGNNAKEISDWAFHNTRITSINLPNGLISIGMDAFSQTKLTSVTIPDSVEVIGEAAFYELESLKSVVISKDSNLQTIGVSAFQKTGITNILIPASVTRIEFGAFMNCSNLTNITLPAGLTYLGGNAFENCSKLTSINIPDGLPIIYDWTFKRTNLQSVTIPGSVKSIGQGAFSIISGLTSVYISEGVEIIDEYAFEQIGITSITLPESMNTIHSGAFFSCTKLSSVTILAEDPPKLIQLGKQNPGNPRPNWFDGNATNRLFYVPDNSVEAYKTASLWSNYINNIHPISQAP